MITSIVYAWVAGSVPPPYHYELTIRLAPDGGEIVLIPDYPHSDTPQWSVPFPVSPADWKSLETVLDKAQALRARWTTPRRQPVGGEHTYLTIHTDQGDLTVPAVRSQRDDRAIQPVFDAIRAMVPPEIVSGLMAQRDAYMAAHER